jgi:hypothetical protein
VKVQGEAVVLAGGEFRANITIPQDGPFTIKIEVQDAARNLADTTVTVTLDTVEPTLKLTGPLPGAVTNQTGIRVSGKTEPGAKVRLGNVMVLADSRGFFNTSVALPEEGQNTILVEATDAAGNTAESSVVVFRDTVLYWNVTRPAEKTRQKSVVVSGMAEAGSAVTVAGSPVSLAANGSFSVQVPLETGPNAIRVTVRDAAGNQAETVIEVTREKAPAGKSTPGFECVLALSAMALALAAWRKGQ